MMATGRQSVQVPREKWFESLFGFSELDNQGRIHQKFQLVGDTLHCTENGASYKTGAFSTPSLAELRERSESIAAQSEKSKPWQLCHSAVRDIFELHAQPEYERACFMAASQTNCLEFAHYSAVPEDGISGYIYDGTQGPACALAAPAATVVRNYFVETADGQIGQSATNQLNIFSNLLKEIQGDEEWIETTNGYTLSDDTKLALFNKSLQSATAGGTTERDKLMGLLNVGLHSNVQVPWTGKRYELLHQELQTQRVSQVFCSAVARSYSEGRSSAWEPFARLVLDASYEATLLLAAIEKAEGRGSGKVLLTKIGGGAFGNKDEWIERAIARACVACEHLDLVEVTLCHHGRIDDESVESIRRFCEELKK